MTIIPAIDLLDGKVVRLLHGNYSKVTEYQQDPVDAAKALADLGAVRIHVVDLNAARAKSDGTDRSVIRTNRVVLERIRSRVPVTLEVGGGVRTEDDVHELTDRGIDRLIVGTLFAKNPRIISQWTQTYGPKFIAGIDAKDGVVKVAGWEEVVGTDSGEKAPGQKTPGENPPGALFDTELAKVARDYGIISIIYTNISQDGTLQGPDLHRTQEIARISELPVILSGGIGSDEHIHQVIKQEEERLGNLQSPDEAAGSIVGIITGKAYYEGRINLPSLYQRYPQIQGDW